MNFWKTFICAAALGIASANLALPQSYVSRASFNLPYEAHWNSMVLKPGTYQLSIPAGSGWPQLVQLSKDGETVTLLAATESSVLENGTTQLRVQKFGSTAVVTDLDLGSASKSFHFSVPKTLRREIADSHVRPSTKTVALVSASK